MHTSHLKDGYTVIDLEKTSEILWLNYFCSLNESMSPTELLLTSPWLDYLQCVRNHWTVSVWGENVIWYEVSEAGRGTTALHSQLFPLGIHGPHLLPTLYCPVGIGGYLGLPSISPLVLMLDSICQEERATD